MRAIRRLRTAWALAALVMVVAWVWMAGPEVDEETSVTTFSTSQDDGDLDSVEATDPAAQLTVSPGRTVAADLQDRTRGNDGAPAEGRPGPAEGGPAADRRAAPSGVLQIHWMNVAAAVAPLLLIAAGCHLGFQRMGRKHREINYGVYKGPMPIELHLARRRWIRSLRRGRPDRFRSAR